MAMTAAVFSRRYRAALLDYLLDSREDGLARAYELGRTAAIDGLGLLELLRSHEKAIHAVLESNHGAAEIACSLRGAHAFLMEALSPFEITYRGFVAVLLESSPVKSQEPRPDRRPAG